MYISNSMSKPGTVTYSIDQTSLTTFYCFKLESRLVNVGV